MNTVRTPDGALVTTASSGGGGTVELVFTGEQFQVRPIDPDRVIRSEIRSRNARNVGAWWNRFAGGIHCMDLRDDDLRRRGLKVASEVRAAAGYAAGVRMRKEIDVAKRLIGDAANILFFRRQAD